MRGKEKNQNRAENNELEITIHKRKIEVFKNVYIMSYKNPPKLA